VAEDAVLTIAASGVLANDTDAEGTDADSGGRPRSRARHAHAERERLVHVHAGGELQRSRRFTYTASDGSASSNVATVTITVTAVNDAPVGANDSYTTNEDTALNVAAPGVLGNDTDVEASALTAAVVTGPAHGTLTLNASGSFSYTPASNYNGPDSFTYRASDGTCQLEHGDREHHRHGGQRRAGCCERRSVLGG
jgi:hypothetical protein